MDTPYAYTCDWSGCPSHERINLHGAQMLSVIWGKEILYFYATDCLALWAGSFPIGYVPAGEAVDGNGN